MATIEINSTRISYEISGPDGGVPIVLTPGGRFGMDVPGLRVLAERLTANGMRVLLWDRPNCGASDVLFCGPSESHMRAEILAALLRELDMAPAVVAGGSGGARDSIITAMRHPDVARSLVVWHVVGGVYSQMRLASVYILPTLEALALKGIDGVLELPHWRDRIAVNPRNRDRLLAIGADGLRAIMLRWLHAYVPKPGQTIPGVLDDDLEGIAVPTVIIRGGRDDLDHPRRTSFELHLLIHGSRLAEPPWPEDGWERGLEASARGDGHFFDLWADAAEVILEAAANPTSVGPGVT